MVSSRGEGSASDEPQSSETEAERTSSETIRTSPVEEAGGRVTGVDGTAYSSRSGSVLATNGHVHDQMLDVIRGFQSAWGHPGGS